MVRRKQGSYPSNRSDGDQVYFDTGTSISDTGLTPGTTYFYRSWSEVSGSQQFSDGYADATATTSGGAPAAVGGEIFPVNKLLVLAPWIALSIIASLAVASIVVLLKRKMFS